VTAFDVAVGIGEVLAEDGESYRFHCSAIAGGARVIALDTRVIFSLAAFHRGEIQASDLIETT
jgi:hypothetical protein